MAGKTTKNRPHFKGKVLMALSGGVDSAVAAYKLLEGGFEVVGGHMVCWDEGPYCSADADRASAARVATALGIKLKVFDFRTEYKEKVVDYFVGEYKAGRTPNPDVACNKEIKFGIFFEKALELGYDFVATGHYARVSRQLSVSSEQEDQFKLLAGIDGSKDQSYFLYTLTQRQLSKTLFPIGHLTKSEVRAIAARLNLPNATRADSQGICFVGEVAIREFLSKRIKNKIGNIISQSGEVLGKHEGVAFYTIGQREGLKVSKSVPHYIVEKRAETNTLVAAPFGDEAIFKEELVASEMSWVSHLPKVGEAVSARVRYRQPLVKGEIVSATSNKLKLKFFEPVSAITPGQAVVLYQGEEIIGGGTIG